MPGGHQCPEPPELRGWIIDLMCIGRNGHASRHVMIDKINGAQAVLTNVVNEMSNWDANNKSEEKHVAGGYSNPNQSFHIGLATRSINVFAASLAKGQLQRYELPY